MYYQKYKTRNTKLDFQYHQSLFFLQITGIATGARHSLLLTEDGEVYSFGDNLCGQCGVSLHSVRFDIPKVKFFFNYN